MEVSILIGVPGCGKSTFSKELLKIKRNVVILSSDEIRSNLSANKAKNTNYVFSIFYDKLFKFLDEGKDIIIDSTNIERSNRLKLIKKIKEYNKDIKIIGYLLDTPYDVIIERMKFRNRKVPAYIVKKYLSKFDFPLLSEGFDDIEFVHEKGLIKYNIDKDEFINIVNSKSDYESLYNVLNKSKIFSLIYKFNQENVYHNYLLCEHTFNVYDYVNNLYLGSSKESLFKMQVASLFHDLGKPLTKVYKENRGYYSYFGHEHVSSLIALNFLLELDFTKDFIFDVIKIIEFHMLISYGGKEGESEIYHLCGTETLVDLYFFKEADVFAK